VGDDRVDRRGHHDQARQRTHSGVVDCWLTQPYSVAIDSPRLTHVRVNVSDLLTSIEWYEALLDTRAEGHWPTDAPTYAHFNVGPIQFALGQYEPVPSNGVRFNFEVDDIDAWWQRLRSTTTVLEQLTDTAYGTRKFTILDPDGNELGFIRADSRLPASRST
jgi:predicted enzyme related to lactoylglutathione lyase